MEKQKKVVDASVIVKWFVSEKDSDKAVKIRDEHVAGKTLLIAPELAFIEVLNALKYKGVSEEKLLEVNKSLWDLQLKIENIRASLLDKAINCSLKNKITLYDAIYVVLAQMFGSELITADSELYKIPNVVPLEKA
ncbi:MAG: type II toxin-antitoxin system VapC family toxin [Nanoarchaeota archaeon]